MSWAEKYIAIPFVEKGRDKAGLDCYGLVRLVYGQEIGIDLPDYLAAYETTDDREALNALISHEKSQLWREKPNGRECEFDVAVLKMRGVPMHVGVVIGGGKMLHCLKGVGTSIERYNSIKWQSSVAGFFGWQR